MNKNIFISKKILIHSYLQNVLVIFFYGTKLTKSDRYYANIVLFTVKTSVTYFIGPKQLPQCICIYVFANLVCRQILSISAAAVADSLHSLKFQHYFLNDNKQLTEPSLVVLHFQPIIIKRTEIRMSPNTEDKQVEVMKQFGITAKCQYCIYRVFQNFCHLL